MTPRYVIIDSSGRAHNVKDGWDWFAILNYVENFSQGAAGNAALPSKLLRDGKIIVEFGLAGVAYNYRKAEVAAREAALAEVKKQFPEPAP